MQELFVVEAIEDVLDHPARVPSRHRELVYEKRSAQVNAPAHTVG
jgi:hypothetical protein